MGAPFGISPFGISVMCYRSKSSLFFKTAKYDVAGAPLGTYSVMCDRSKSSIYFFETVKYDVT